MKEIWNQAPRATRQSFLSRINENEFWSYCSWDEIPLPIRSLLEMMRENLIKPHSSQHFASCFQDLKSYILVATQLQIPSEVVINFVVQATGLSKKESKRLIKMLNEGS